MAHIIEMESFRRARPAHDREAGSGAEILFFLGVRYERMPEAPPVTPRDAKETTRPARRSRKRRA